MIIEAGIVEKYFGTEEHVHLVFHPDKQEILVAPRSLAFFEKLHKNAEWTALKLKNAKGDRSISVRHILLDHDLDMEDRELKYEARPLGFW
ncbi:MAG: hypothetical protein LRY55_05960 [Leadbetterella sp.]|nr:hypothetical protein [Leadbetterella sp.]